LVHLQEAEAILEEVSPSPWQLLGYGTVSGNFFNDICVIFQLLFVNLAGFLKLSISQCIMRFIFFCKMIYRTPPNGRKQYLREKQLIAVSSYLFFLSL